MNNKIMSMMFFCNFLFGNCAFGMMESSVFQTGETAVNVDQRVDHAADAYFTNVNEHEPFYSDAPTRPASLRHSLLSPAENLGARSFHVMPIIIPEGQVATAPSNTTTPTPPANLDNAYVAIQIHTAFESPVGMFGQINRGESNRGESPVDMFGQIDRSREPFNESTSTQPNVIDESQLNVENEGAVMSIRNALNKKYRSGCGLWCIFVIFGASGCIALALFG